jgi:hypothetical protein
MSQMKKMKKYTSRILVLGMLTSRRMLDLHKHEKKLSYQCKAVGRMLEVAHRVCLGVVTVLLLLATCVHVSLITLAVHISLG